MHNAVSERDDLTQKSDNINKKSRFRHSPDRGGSTNRDLLSQNPKVARYQLRHTQKRTGAPSPRLRFAIIAPRAGFVKRKLAGKRENDKKVRLPGVTGKTAASRQEGKGAAGKQTGGRRDSRRSGCDVSREEDSGSKGTEREDAEGKTKRGASGRYDG